MTKEGTKIGKAITSQLVRDINATVKMGRNVYLVRNGTIHGTEHSIRLSQARTSVGRLQVKSMYSREWLSVSWTDQIQGA